MAASCLGPHQLAYNAAVTPGDPGAGEEEDTRFPQDRSSCLLSRDRAECTLGETFGRSICSHTFWLRDPLWTPGKDLPALLMSCSTLPEAPASLHATLQIGLLHL